MAQPKQHPKTGYYQFRRVVPKDLRALVGKTEVVESLGTRDFSEARVRYAKRSAEVEEWWANLRKGSQPITKREAHNLARIVHDGWIERHQDNPSEATSWRTEAYDQLWASLPYGT